MLFIFDLDDTLIQTTAQVTPPRLRNALKKMVDGGLKVENYEKALTLMERLDSTAQSSASSLSEFVELYEGDYEFFEIAKGEVYHAPMGEDSFAIDEGVNEVLQELAKDHLLAIVTRGNREIQYEKIKRFGIDEGLFCDIIVTGEKNKGVHYGALARTHGFSFREVVVVGDRIEVDLADAIQLGCITVHIRQGRGANCQWPVENIDYTIYDLRELLGITEIL